MRTMPIKLLRWFIPTLILIYMILGCEYIGGTPTQKITIATGEQGGLYHQFGLLLKEKVEQQSNITLTLQTTQGSKDNAELIKNQQVDFSIVQSGINSFDTIDVVTPLFVEPIFILATPKSGIETIADLSGKNIKLGNPGSGSRVSGERILQHYEIDSFNLYEGYLSESDQELIDAAIVVGGLLNQDLKNAIKKHNLRLVDIKDAKAISLKHTHLHPFTIPRGIFSENPAIPNKDMVSIASTAMLVSRKGVNETMIKLLLKSIYETNLRAHFPLMMTPDEVKSWALFPLKPASLKFLDPYSGITLFSSFAESLAAIKELIVGLFALAYFTWASIKRRQARKATAELAALKEKLDTFLDQTVAIERQYHVNIDQKNLERLLQQVTEIKLNALEELSNEQLRGDGLFAIFMIQCSNLIMRMEQHLKG